ncbi:helix-turn-helix domain-containing protein [Billgrantia gudaonensis]|uniref:Helix-turn-helix n=1 Tax=Billgrantia gudaonensis TaxID=376427 RepID=A0A1G8MP36_9GAMM|nr:helix-turn-helix domain-containing protein [Halomonas gudaonensis]SDI69684.1 Helix-turn-helix [Halomonas gudaonensis]
MEALGPRIKQLRQHANLNKAALARKVGVSDVTISYWESGAIKQIGHERLVALAEALQCPLSQLLEGDDTSRATPLYLHGKPPAPWLAPSANRITLPAELVAGDEWQDDCYLITPAPGERFDFLAPGDLAAISPADAFDRAGRYLIEDDRKLTIAYLERNSQGELQRHGEAADETGSSSMDGTQRVVGKVLARWRRERL